MRVAIAVACWSISLAAPHAVAAVFQVDSNADTVDANAGDGVCADASGACSLRAAVEEANALAGADEVSIPAGTYVLTHPTYGLLASGDLSLRGAGAGATVISRGGRGGSVIYSDGSLVLERLRITGGAYSGGFSAALIGGGSLVLSEAIVSGNGGLGVLAFGALTVTRSAITGNLDGAILQGGEGTGRISNTTISGNVTRNTAICIPGYSWCECQHQAAVSGPLEIEDSTIANNSRDPSTCEAQPPSLSWAVEAHSIRGTVLSNPGLDDCIGPEVSLGHNLISDESCGESDPTDISGVVPLLGPLADNGGPTPTHALLAGSPAIDAIPPADCTWDHDGDPGTAEVPLEQDQRGGYRPREGNGIAPRGCDIGSYEVTRCADGIDNDGDGHIDFDGGTTAGLPTSVRTAPDARCASAQSASETSSCGLGAELALLGPLAWWTRRRRADRKATMERLRQPRLPP